eukprot:11833618-Heterocapsa_arctica.AAC.1
MNSEPKCLWRTGVITERYFSLPISDYMRAADNVAVSNEKAIKNNIDGSATKIGASAYAGWGMWSPDNDSFKENGAIRGSDQGSDRAEVRALLAALEKSIGKIE